MLRAKKKPAWANPRRFLWLTFAHQPWLCEAGLFSLGFFDFGPVNQFHESHGGVITLTETHFEHTSVTTVALFVARADLVKQLGNGVAVTQAGERQATVCQGRFFAERNEWLYNAAQFLGLGQCGLDRFVSDQGHSHVTEHGLTMAAGTVELTKPFAVTHDDFL